MKLAIVILTGYYLFIALRLFQIWAKFLQRDTDMSPQQRRFSWAVLTVGVVLWPLVVPISYLTLLEEKLAKKAETGEIEAPQESPDRFSRPEMANSTK
jgi:hypothetical protein